MNCIMGVVSETTIERKMKAMETRCDDYMKYVFMQVRRRKIIKSSALTTPTEKNRLLIAKIACRGSKWKPHKSTSLNQQREKESRMEIKVIFLRAEVGCITSGRYFLRRTGAAVQLPETFCSWSEDKHCVCERA